MRLKKTPTTRPLWASRSKANEGVTQCKCTNAHRTLSSFFPEPSLRQASKCSIVFLCVLRSCLLKRQLQQRKTTRHYIFECSSFPWFRYPQYRWSQILLPFNPPWSGAKPQAATCPTRGSAWQDVPQEKLNTGFPLCFVAQCCSQQPKTCSAAWCFCCLDFFWLTGRAKRCSRWGKESRRMYEEYKKEIRAWLAVGRSQAQSSWNLWDVGEMRSPVCNFENKNVNDRPIGIILIQEWWWIHVGPTYWQKEMSHPTCTCTGVRGHAAAGCRLRSKATYVHPMWETVIRSILSECSCWSPGHG